MSRSNPTKSRPSHQRERSSTKRGVRVSAGVRAGMLGGIGKVLGGVVKE